MIIINYYSSSVVFHFESSLKLRFVLNLKDTGQINLLLLNVWVTLQIPSDIVIVTVICNYCNHCCYLLP